MSEMKRFIPINETGYALRKNGIEMEFSINDLSTLRRWKERPENQLEPDINEIQKFVSREQ